MKKAIKYTILCSMLLLQNLQAAPGELEPAEPALRIEKSFEYCGKRYLELSDGSTWHIPMQRVHRARNIFDSDRYADPARPWLRSATVELRRSQRGEIEINNSTAKKSAAARQIDLHLAIQEEAVKTQMKPLNIY